MGRWISKFSEPSPFKVILVGLDATGKTTILYRLKYNDIVTSFPTVGFNVETIRPCKGVHVTIWDVGGSEKTRPLWKPYLKNIDGLMFVVDSRDLNRMEEAKEELDGILKLADVPLVVLANKQDIQVSLSPSQIAERLELSKICDRKWSIFGTCGLTGEGVLESLKNLTAMMKTTK